MMTTDKATLTIENGIKKFRSKSYNYNFRISDGYFMRWGATVEEDPEHSPFSPEIADIEISYGDTCSIRCNFCYKGNGTGGDGVNMSLERFKTLFEKFPKMETVTVELENGTEIILSKNSTVTLSDGRVVCASELKETDEVLKFS